MYRLTQWLLLTCVRHVLALSIVTIAAGALSNLRAQDAPLLNWSEDAFTDYVQVLYPLSWSATWEQLLVDESPKSLAKGDFNHSGYEDIIIFRNDPAEPKKILSLANYGPEGLWFFAPPNSVALSSMMTTNHLSATGQYSKGIVDDFNQDGWLDMVWVGDHGHGSKFRLNRGEGTAGSSDWAGFWTYTLSMIAPAASYFIDGASGDINGDGLPDVILHSRGGGELGYGNDMVLINVDGTSFQDQTELWLSARQRTASGSNVALVDCDGDGDLDIIKSSFDTPIYPWYQTGVFVGFNDGDSFTNWVCMTTEIEDATSFKVADFDADGKDDVYVVGDENDGWYRQVAGEDLFEFLPITHFPVFGSSGRVAAGDVDLDGLLDVVVSGASEPSCSDATAPYLFQFDGSSFSNAQGATGNLPWQSDFFDAAIVDLNGDGMNDLLLAGCQGMALHFSENCDLLEDDTDSDGDGMFDVCDPCPFNSSPTCEETHQMPIISDHGSIARQWNEMLLASIRHDFSRPTVHARNLFHTSAAMWDAWANFFPEAKPYLFGNEAGIEEFPCSFEDFPIPSDPAVLEEELDKAIAYSVCRILQHRFVHAPGWPALNLAYPYLLEQQGFDPNFTGEDYSTGDGRALGNAIAGCYIAYGMQDGSNEANDYASQSYLPSNPPTVFSPYSFNPFPTHINRWQPLTFAVFEDQSSNIIESFTPPFVTPEWGSVNPFSLTEEQASYQERAGHTYRLFLDPGAPPTWSPNSAFEDDEWAYAHTMTALWSGHLDATDGVMWDISPGGIGNRPGLPTDFEEAKEFYNFYDGGTTSPGHPVNPKTGLVYEPNVVPRGDYARVLAEFWADGPDSETPPGHWFTILNVVNDDPDLERRLFGVGEILNELEWDVKAYFTLGGAMHDAAVSTWSAKGWYDTARPYSAIRSMATLGQRTDPTQPHYHAGGLPLIEDYIELQEHPNGNLIINMKAWNNYCDNDWVSCNASEAWGVDWKRARTWRPYQRSTFVTPPFAGYLSGHSTFSRAAAEVLTQLTGDAFFPGGVGEFEAPADDFLVFEPGPSQPITLQWATYRDAADESGLSRIWGGIHPFFDDYKARENGRIIGLQVAQKAKTYFVGEVPGCMDLAACNYDPLATVEAACLYGTEYFVPSVIGQPVVTPCTALEVPNGYSVVDSECYLFAVTGQDQCYMNWSTACHEALEACLNEELGCTDPLACNFEATATYDIGDCQAAEQWLIPDVLTGLPALPFCGSLDEIPSGYSIGQFGCVQSIINNDNQCLTNWGSTCHDEYESCVVPGCTLFLACNYDASANFNDGSCILPGTPCNDYDACTVFSFYGPDCICTGPILDADDDGVCDGADCAPNHPEWPDVNGNCPQVGCTDITACNYDASAEVDDGSCEAAVHWLIPDVISGGPAIPWCADISSIPTGYSVGLFECVASVISNDSYCIVTSWDGICQSAYEACLNPGCTNDVACNFNPSSNLDDGSCIIAGTPCEDYNYCTPSSFWSDNCECVGIIADSDNDGVCDYSDCAPLNPYQPNALGVCLDLEMGCTDVNACNYDPEAILDDGSCSGTTQWIIPSVPGSETPALQWCTEDVLPEGYELAEQTCAAIVIANDDFCVNSFWDAICQGAYEDCLDSGGCLNSMACNFAPSAQYEDGSCVFQGDACSTEGVCTGDGIVNANCNCEETVVDSDGDGICDALEISGCTDENAVNYNPFATDEDGGCFIPGCKESDACNYNPTANMDDGSCAYPGMPCFINPCAIESYWNDVCECVGDYVDEDNDGVCIGEDCDDANPEVPQFITCEEFFGCTNPIACNYAPEAIEDDGSCMLPQGWFIPMNGVTGSAVPMCTDGDEVPEGYELAEAFCMELILVENPSCLLGTWSSLSACSAVYNECAAEVGCMVETASNYDPSATFNDAESCVFLGCTSQDAFNYDPQATADDGSCEPIILGCTDLEAFNFDASANVDDDSCTLPVYGCIDSSAMNYNQSANVDDGSCQYALGCTDPTALNYDPLAQYDDASCMYSEDDVPGCTSPFALNYNPDADYNDGSCIFELPVPGCTDPSACNFSAGASDDDGSCVFDGPACACAFDIAFDTDTLGPLETHIFVWNGGIASGLETVNVDLDFTPINGGNFPSDLIVGICDPNGTCMEFGGYNSTLGYNGMGLFPSNWSTSLAGTYSASFDVTAAGLSGAGDWTFELKNTFSGATSIWYGSFELLGNCGTPQPIAGCTDNTACNFNPEAETDDESCVYEGPLCGCTLVAPFSVALGAGETDSGTQYASVPGGLLTILVDLDFSPGTSGNYASDLAIGVCDPNGNCIEIGGYNLDFGFTSYGNFPLSWQSPSEGNYQAEFDVADAGLMGAGDWSVQFLNGFSSAGTGAQWTGTVTFTGDCDEAIAGCTDETACNFNAAATSDDASCIHPGDPCYGLGPCYPDAVYTADCGCDGTFEDADGDGVCSAEDCDDNNILIPANGSCDDLWGCTDITACNYEESATADDGSCIEPDYWLIPGFEQPGPALPWCGSLDELPIGYIVGDFYCVDQVVDAYYSCVDYAWNSFGGGAFDYCEDSYTACQEAAGCMDLTACNYDDTATAEDGSCLYPGALCEEATDCATEAYYDADCGCNPDPLGVDSDGDGICDVDEIAGCTNDLACNYNPAATDSDDSCYFVGQLCDWGVPACPDTYSSVNEDCECVPEVPDTDGDGVCDEDEIAGCQDPLALNYDPNATDEGDCEYDQGGGEVFGCMDPDACNYFGAATMDDGSCYYPNAGYDCDGTCLVDTDGDEVCDGNEVLGCTDAEACNFDPLATDDDGSCGGEKVWMIPIGTSTGPAILGCASELPADYIIGDFECVAEVVAIDSYCLNNYWDQICYDAYNACLEASAGCTDVAACNYDPSASTEDGSCIFPGDPCADLGPCYTDAVYTADCGCDGTFQDADGDGVCAAEDCDDNNILIPANGTCDDLWGCTDITACNYDEIATADDGSCIEPDYWLIPAFEQPGPALPWCGSLDDLPIGYMVGDYYCVDQVVNEYVSCLSFAWNSFGGGAFDYCEDSYEDCQIAAGCMDPTACNFDDNATEEDGSCLYPGALCAEATGCALEAYYDADCGCNPEPLGIDTDGDGVCDEDEIEGCMNDLACNYNPAATDSDGSCYFIGQLCDWGVPSCSGNLNTVNEDCECVPDVPDTDGDGVCDEDEVAGCQDPLAINYDPNATDDSGSCEYDDGWEDIYGCMDSGACNYYPDATMDDGSCYYPQSGYDCQGNCLMDSDGDGICDVFEIGGCTDLAADNFNPDATDDDGSCEYGPSLPGCTDPEAVNYDPDATVDDGSCNYPLDDYFGCTDSGACNYNPFSEEDDGSCYFPSAEFDCDGNCIDSDGDGVCDVDELPGCTDATATNYNADATDDDGSCEYEEVIEGCTDELACNYNPDATAYDGSCTYLWDEPGCTGPLAMNYNPNAVMDDGTCAFLPTLGCTDPGACNFLPDAELDDGMCHFPDQYHDCAGNCLNDADGDGLCDEYEIPGCMDQFAINHNYAATDDDGSCVYEGVWGCTDSEACNYYESATIDDGSCDYPNEYTDCDGDCLNDADGDGLCDEYEIPGCTDQFAINHNYAATDDDGSCVFEGVLGCMDSEACNYYESATIDEGSCDYPNEFTDCDGNCLNDADGDGLCDEYEVAGCMEQDALNYNDAATDDDGSCVFPAIIGCLDQAACNYYPPAEVDDGSCVYPPPLHDCMGECFDDSDGDGVCDALEVAGCTDDAAVNFNAFATDDDGSCAFGLTAGCTYPDALNFNADADYEDGSCEFANEGDACPTDLDNDGTVAVSDLLVLLSAYGEECSTNE